MNRLEFIGQTYKGSMMSVDDIIRYFDHSMAAYNVIRDTNHISVDGEPDNANSSLILKIKSPDPPILEGLVALLNNTDAQSQKVYGKYFKINIDADDTDESFIKVSVHEFENNNIVN